MIASLGRPFGVDGWLHVRSFTAPPDNVLRYRPWRLRRPGMDTAWQMAGVETRNHAGAIIARIDGCEDRESAAALRGTEVGIDALSLPETASDEYYWRDLVGLAAFTAEEHPLGQVARLFPTPAHDVLVLADTDRERLVPFTKETVAEVDLASQRIVLNWQADWD